MDSELGCLATDRFEVSFLGPFFQTSISSISSILIHISKLLMMYISKLSMVYILINKIMVGRVWLTSGCRSVSILG